MTALLILLSFAAQDDLATVVDRLEAGRKDLRDLRAEWRFLRVGKPADRLESSGRILLRAPGDAAWTATADRGELIRAASATGIRGTLLADALVVHAPWTLEPIGRRTERHPHHGAEWFTGNPAKDSPALFPVLAMVPQDFPGFALLDLAPRRFLSMLPGLWVLGRFKEGEKEYVVLKSQPPARNMRDEDQRGWGESWTEVKIWIDPSDFRLARVAVRSDCDAVGPTEDEWVCDYAKRDAAGIPVEMSIRHHVPKRPTLGSSWRLELGDLKVNGGLTLEELAFQVPADRVSRDWVLQLEAVYEERLKKDPKDASAWLSLGSLRLQRHEGNVLEPFRKVIELRPAAAEGYVGMLFALERSKAGRLPILEEAVRAGVKSAQIHAELASRHAELGNVEPARRHFEEALKLGGDVPELLVAASKWGDAEGRLLRAIKAEGRRETYAYGAWKALRPGPESRLDLYRFYERTGAGLSRVQARMVDLAHGLGQPEEAARHANAVVTLLGKDIRTDDDYAVNRTLQFFLEARDFESAARLQRAVAAWPDDKWSMRAVSMECRIHVLRDSMDELLKFLDEGVPKDRLTSLTVAIRDEKKVDAVVEALLATPAPHPKRAWRGEVLESLVKDHYSGSRQGELLIKAGEMRRGDGRPEEILQLARTLTHEKKWKEARAKAGEMLARATTPQHRFDAEHLIAECFLAEGDSANAVAACDRALKEDAKHYREYAYLLRARAQGPEDAARTFAAAFEDPAARAGILFAEIPKQTPSWAEILAWAEKGDAPLGRLSVLALARSATGNAAGAAEAIGRAADLRKGDLAFVRQRLRLRAAALQVGEALADRALLGEADLQAVNQEILAACERKNDAAVMKTFARTLAGEYWSPKRCDTQALSQLLQAIREEGFCGEVEKLLVAGSDKEYAPVLATQLLIWAWDGMGWHDLAIARCRAVLADPKAAKNHEMMRSWIGSLERNKRGYVDPVEALAARVKDAGGDPIRALEVALAGGRGDRHLDRLWRAALRSGKATPIHYQIGALRSDVPAEQARLLEEVVERFSEAAEWRIRLAILYLRTGKPDLGLKNLRDALAAVPAEHSAWGSLEGELKILTAEQLAELVPRLEEKGLYRIAWDLYRGPLEGRLALSEKWRAAAKGEEEKARAALAAAGVLNELKRPVDALDALSEVDDRALSGGDLPSEIRRRRTLFREQEWKRLNELAQGGDRKELARGLHRSVRRRNVTANDVEGYVYLVMARGGKVLEFVVAWEEATALEPPSVGATLFLARLQDLAGQHTEVRRVLEEGLKAFPGEVAFYPTLAKARMRMEDFKGAAELLEASVAREPESFDLRSSLVFCYAQLGRKDEAVAQLRGMERKGAHGVLGSLAARARLHDEALRLFRLAVAEEPARADSWRLLLARSLREAGKDAEAETELKAILRSTPERALSAARELIELFSRKDRPAEIAKLLLEPLAEEKDAARRRRFVEWAAEVPEPSRAKVLEAWDEAAGKDVRRRLATVTLIVTWGGTPEKALDRLREVEADAPDSVWVYLERERLLRTSTNPEEVARVQERLAELDAKGEAGGLPAPARRLAALQLHVQLQNSDAILRVGLLVLFDPAKTEVQAQEARRSIAVAVSLLDEKAWPKLKKLTLPAVDPKAAARARALVAKLSDEEFDVRTAARRELHLLGAPALASLLPLVDSEDLDLRTHARGAVEDILTR